MKGKVRNVVFHGGVILGICAFERRVGHACGIQEVGQMQAVILAIPMIHGPLERVTARAVQGAVRKVGRKGPVLGREGDVSPV